MAYYKRKKRSLASIEREINHTLKEIEKYKGELSVALANRERFVITREELIKTHEMEGRLRLAKNSATHTTLWFFGLKQQRDPAGDKYSEFQKTEAYKRYIKDGVLNSEISRVKKEIKQSTHYLEDLEAQAIPLRKKRDSLLELKAAAATSAKEIRDLANATKRKIKGNELCPYCGDTIGSTPHADHIYPVSRGGRSEPRNMVYVCGKCNIKKSSLTLSQFIKKYNLDRDAIEDRLTILHKDF